ncbi:MAG: oligosaccharide flippase family protein [Cyanobacteria bacterium P01_B01_bin.77]
MLNLSLLSRLGAKFGSALKSPSLRGVFVILSSRLLRIFLQGGYFITLARTLGAEQYGLFVGVLALVKLMAPFASWGSPQILVKHVSRSRENFARYWGNALLTCLGFGTLCLIIVCLVAYSLFSNTLPITIIVCVGIAEFIFARFHDVSLKAFLAMERLSSNAQLVVFNTFMNLAAALCLAFFFSQPTAITWGFLYLASRMILGLAAVGLVIAQCGMPTLAPSLIRAEILEGFYFSVGLSAQTVYNDVDKTMLARLSTFNATGIYGAAYRILDVAMTPVMAALTTVYAKFFRKGAQGIRGSVAVAQKVLPLVGVYSLISSLALCLFAPLVPRILGDEYSTAVAAIRWLSPLLVFKTLQYFAADTLTGAGYQSVRTALQVSLALFNGIANLWLIPLYSWKGAAWSSLISDGLLAISLWLLVFYFARVQARPAIRR